MFLGKGSEWLGKPLREGFPAEMRLSDIAKFSKINTKLLSVVLTS